MLKKTIFGLLVILLISLPLLTSCDGTDTTPSTSPAASPTTGSSSTPAAAANWWEEKWGEPQYGGTIGYRVEQVDTVFFDPGNPMGFQYQFWQECLFGHDFTLDRDIYAYDVMFVPVEYREGWLAESWEQTDPTTITVKLKEGIAWQDKAPTYGREFVAADVEYTYDRILGTGHGFTEPNAFRAGNIPAIQKATAVDDYTVEFKLKYPSAMALYQIVGTESRFGMVSSEWIALGQEGQEDWQNAIGTGPFILSGIVEGSSITFDRNPNYWGYDERYPDNQLPYVDQLKLISIVDMPTALAALKTGKIDIIADERAHPSLQEAESLAKSNPEILQTYWYGSANGMSLRVDREPFTDINVRKAMQMAIDIESIANGYYGGKTDPTPVGLMSPKFGEKWAVPFEDWPAELQEEYTYSPEKARQLLADAGYPEGFETSVIASVVDDTALLQILKSNLSDIGIEMTIDSGDKITQSAIVRARQHEQMSYGTSAGGSTSTPTLLTYRYENLQNASCNNDPYYEDLADQFDAATTMEEAQRIFREADQYALEQHWVITTCPVPSAQVWQPWLGGYGGELIFSVWGFPYFAHMWVDQEIKASYGY